MDKTYSIIILICMLTIAGACAYFMTRCQEKQFIHLQTTIPISNGGYDSTIVKGFEIIEDEHDSLVTKKRYIIKASRAN